MWPERWRSRAELRSFIVPSTEWSLVPNWWYWTTWSTCSPRWVWSASWKPPQVSSKTQTHWLDYLTAVNIHMSGWSHRVFNTSAWKMDEIFLNLQHHTSQLVQIYGRVYKSPHLLLWLKLSSFKSVQPVSHLSADLIRFIFPNESECVEATDSHFSPLAQTVVFHVRWLRRVMEAFVCLWRGCCSAAGGKLPGVCASAQVPGRGERLWGSGRSRGAHDWNHREGTWVFLLSVLNGRLP